MTVDGELHEFDVLLYGTGFQPSKFLTPMKVVGRGGVDLHDRWDGDARAYLGVTVPGFPNFFMLYGPNTNIVVNGSIIWFTECEVRYVMDCHQNILAGDHRAIDVKPDVHDALQRGDRRREPAHGVGRLDVNSWYKNESGRVAQNWPFPLLEFWKRTREVDPGRLPSSCSTGRDLFRGRIRPGIRTSPAQSHNPAQVVGPTSL